MKSFFANIKSGSISLNTKPQIKRPGSPRLPPIQVKLIRWKARALKHHIMLASGTLSQREEKSARNSLKDTELLIMQAERDLTPP